MTSLMGGSSWKCAVVKVLLISSSGPRNFLRRTIDRHTVYIACTRKISFTIDRRGGCPEVERNCCRLFLIILIDNLYFKRTNRVWISRDKYSILRSPSFSSLRFRISNLDNFQRYRKTEAYNLQRLTSNVMVSGLSAGSGGHAIKVRNWLHRSRSNVNWMAFGGVCRGTRAAIILSMLESQPSSGYTRWRACLHAHNKCVHGYACSWPSKVFTRDVVPCSCTAGAVCTYVRLWIKDRGWRLQFRAGWNEYGALG